MAKREMVDERAFWAMADRIKRRLYGRLRIEASRVDYTDYEGYREKFKKIPLALIDEWKKIEDEVRKKYKNKAGYYRIDDFLVRLRGFLYEALFYYACLKIQAFYHDAEFVEFGGNEPYFEEYPPWIEAIPLYGIIPSLHHIQEEGIRKRKVPQVKADFLMTYAEDKGPSPPALIDVKSSEDACYNNVDDWGWQIAAALRKGFIYQFAYPKSGVEYPRDLREWEIRTPCPKCKRLSSESRKCSNCRTEIFPFTIVDARYRLKELMDYLGMSYKGRY